MERIQEIHKDEIGRYVAETIQGFVEDRMTIDELRDFHDQVGEQNRLLVVGEIDADREALRFMHQVTKGALQQLSSRRKRDLIVMRSKSEVRYSAFASNTYLL